MVHLFFALLVNIKFAWNKHSLVRRSVGDYEKPFKDIDIRGVYIVKQVSWFKSSLLLRIQNKHTNKY